VAQVNLKQKRTFVVKSALKLTFITPGFFKKRFLMTTLSASIAWTGGAGGSNHPDSNHHKGADSFRDKVFHSGSLLDKKKHFLHQVILSY